MRLRVKESGFGWIHPDCPSNGADRASTFARKTVHQPGGSGVSHHRDFILALEVVQGALRAGVGHTVQRHGGRRGRGRTGVLAAVVLLRIRIEKRARPAAPSAASEQQAAIQLAFSEDRL
jgi:hypothetical protein